MWLAKDRLLTIARLEGEVVWTRGGGLETLQQRQARQGQCWCLCTHFPIIQCFQILFDNEEHLLGAGDIFAYIERRKARKYII